MNTGAIRTVCAIRENPLPFAEFFVPLHPYLKINKPNAENP